MKILNFHPFVVGLKMPDAEFCRRHKGSITTLGADEAGRLRHDGSGAATFLKEAMSAIQAAGHRFVTLSELAESLGREPLVAGLD